MIDAHAAGIEADSITAQIDQHRWSGYQILLLILVSLAILLDGFDNQSLGFALPAMLKEWGLSKQMLAPALAAAQVGIMIGAICGGVLGDRWGRKKALIISVLLFGAATLGIAFVHGVASLTILRLLAGIGLGSAFPNVAALASEFTPARRGSLAVVISIVCVPLGGALGGLLAAKILPLLGWRVLFTVAGILPLLLAAILAVALPESIRFLLLRGDQDEQVRRILRRMGIANIPTPQPQSSGPQPAPVQNGAIILSPAYRNDTLWLWISFFFCLTAVYTAFGWLPTLLTESGLSVATASQGLAVFNFGGVATALAGGWLIGRFGSRRTMICMAVGAVLSAIAVALFAPNLTSHTVLFVLLAVEGGFVNGVQTTLYALAAYIYPTKVRSTGVGSATGVGRLGAIGSSLLGAIVIGIGGVAGFHSAIASTMLIVLVALVMIKRHRPATASQV